MYVKRSQPAPRWLEKRYLLSASIAWKRYTGRGSMMLSSRKIYPAWAQMGQEAGGSHSFLIGLVAAAVGAVASFIVISSLTNMALTISRPVSDQAMVFHAEPAAAATVEDWPAVAPTAPSPTSAAPASEIKATNREAMPEGNMQSGRKPITDKPTWPHNSYWRSSSRGYRPSHGSISSER
jgi:hypothetical protein